MSIPQSERKQSRAEFAVILQKTEQYFLNLCLDDGEKKIPYLSEEMLKLSIEAYNNATLYFEMIYGGIPSDTALKKKYCKKAIWTIRNLCAQINIFIACRMDKRKPIQEQKLIIQDLIKACDLLQEELKSLERK